MKKNLKILTCLFSITLVLFFWSSLASANVVNQINSTTTIVSTQEIYIYQEDELTGERAVTVVNPTISTTIKKVNNTTMTFQYKLISRGVASQNTNGTTATWSSHARKVYFDTAQTKPCTTTENVISSNEVFYTVINLTEDTTYSSMNLRTDWSDPNNASHKTVVTSKLPPFTTKSSNLLWLWILIGILLFILIVGGGYYSYKSGLIDDLNKEFNDQYKKYSKQINTQIKKYKK